MVCEGVFFLLFRYFNYLELIDYNMICLKRVIRKLVVFCSEILVVYLSVELWRNILIVKKRLKLVDMMVVNEY